MTLNFYLPFCRKSDRTTVAKQLDDVGTTCKPLSSWMEVVERVSRQLGRIVSPSAQEFVNNVCLKYLEDRDKDCIYEHVTKIGKLQKSIYRYQNEVYMLEGAGPGCDRASQVVKDVCNLLKWIEEILCYAMVDFQEVRDCHVGKKFMYQLD